MLVINASPNKEVLAYTGLSLYQDDCSSPWVVSIVDCGPWSFSSSAGASAGASSSAGASASASPGASATSHPYITSGLRTICWPTTKWYTKPGLRGGEQGRPPKAPSIAPGGMVSWEMEIISNFHNLWKSKNSNRLPFQRSKYKHRLHFTFSGFFPPVGFPHIRKLSHLTR